MSFHKKSRATLPDHWVVGNIKRKRRSPLWGEGEYHRDGISRSLHGTIYQLKLSMIYVKRGLDRGYSFELITEDANFGKFDDLCFRYGENLRTKNSYVLLQAKHKLSKSKKISVSDLLNQKGGDFSLQKYFTSYREINENHKFQASQLRDFIICTNAGFKFGDKLGDLELSEAIFEEKDDSSHVLQKKLYQFGHSFPGRDKIVSVLKNSSDMMRLAAVVVKSVLGHNVIRQKALTKEEIALLDYYHIPLSAEIIDIHAKKFRTSFIDNENLSQMAKYFREAFREVIKDFRKSLKLDDDPIMEKGELKELAQYLANLIVKHQDRKTVEIIRSSHAVKTGLDKLAWYVLVRNEGCIRFSSSFLGDDHLPGNLNDFRAQLKNKLSGVPFGSLREYKFVVYKRFNAYEEILTLDEEPFWEEMRKREVSVFDDSKGKNDIRLLESFANAFRGLIGEDKSTGGRTIRIIREGVIGEGIDKLAGYVLVVESGNIMRFSQSFLSSDPLPGNLNDFRSKLNLDFNELSTLRFRISKFPRDSLPDDSISKIENDIESFFRDFKFAVNQPDEKELAKIIKKELGEEFNVVDAKNVYSRFLEKILDWMKEREGPAFSDQDAKGFFEEVKREILGSVYFEVRDPVRLFTGREKELEELHRMLQDNHERLSVVSQIKSVSGLGGIGKTELVKKYVQKYAKGYDENIVWINAETKSTLSQAFFDLAQDNRLGIHLTDKDKSAKPIKSIIREIYNFFARKKSLFVFDNVDDAQCLKEFLPLGVLRASDERPYILITSRNQQWEDGVGCLRLGGLSPKDAVTFVKNGLEIKDESQNKDIEDLVTELEFFPLAIQQAISYIQYHQVMNELSVTNYLAEYRENKKHLLNFRRFEVIDNEYTKTTFTTWDMTFHKIKNDKEYGDLASEVLYIIAYLWSEDIDRRMFMSLARGDESKLKSAVRLLVDYSIVNGKNEQSILSVHKLVQEVVMIQLADQDRNKEVMKRAVRLISDIDNSFESFSSRESFLFHQEILLSHIDSWIAKNPQDRDEISRDSLRSLLPLLGKEYFKIYELEGAAECFKRVLEIEKVSDDKDIVKVVETAIELGRVYEASEKYAEQKQVLLQIEHDVKSIYKPEVSESNRLLGEFLVELGRVSQRLEGFDKRRIKDLFEEGFLILEKFYTKEHPDYPELGEVLMDLSEAYRALGDYEEQRKILDKVLVIFSKCYGGDSFEATEVLVKIAGVYVDLKRYREARDYLNEAVSSPSLHRSDNDRVRKTLSNIAKYTTGLGLDDDEIGKIAAAEKNYIADMVFEFVSGSLEEAEGLILLFRIGFGDAVLRLEFVEDAIEIFQKHYGEGSYKLAKELINLADAYGDVNDHLAQEKVIQERVLPVLLGKSSSNDDHYAIARARLSLANAWEGLKEYEKQLRLLTEKVLPCFATRYGNEHPEVAEIQLSIAIAYGRVERNYAKKVNLIEKAVLPVLKPIFEQLRQSSKIVDVLMTLADAYEHLNNYEKKADCLQNALKSWQLFYSTRTATIYNYDLFEAGIMVNLSETYRILKQYKKQRDILVEALKIYKMHYNPVNEEIIKVRVMLAQAYRNLNQYDQATEVLNDAFPILNDESVFHIDLERTDEVIKFLVDYLVNQQSSLQCSEAGKRTMDSSSSEHSLGKKPRKERSVSMACVDSRDEEKITEEEKEQRIKELFNADNVVEKVKNIEFYNQLFKVSEKISKGEIINKNVEEAFVAKIKDIDLDSIDPEVKDIVKEMKDNIGNKQEVKNILRRSGVAEKIGKVAEGAGLAFTAFLVGKHIANGDIEGLGYDALNLWVMQKIGEKISGKILELGTKLDFQMLRGFAPVMGRTIGNFAAFLGLAESIKARQNATNPVDIKIADLNIATNSIFIAADVPAVVSEIMSSAGIEVAGSIGELADPIGAAVALTVVIIHNFVEAGLEVKRLEGQISLTSREKHELYWNFILDEKFSKNLRNDLEAKQLYEQYIKNLMQKFTSVYDRVSISLPSIMVEKQVSLYCYGSNCRSIVQAVNIKQINNSTTFIDSGRFSKSNWSRVIPTVENYTIACGPLDKDITEDVDEEVLSKSRNIFYGYNSVNNIKRVFSFNEYPPYCNNSIVYERTSSSTYHRSMYYIQHQVAEARFNYNEIIDFVFHGSNVSVASNKEINSSVESRYYFLQRIEDCTVCRPGINFFYITESRFSCDLGADGQKNIVVTQGDFTDSENIHSIIGSDKANHIQVSHSGYVDGKGGNDVITAKNFTVIKGYFGDSVYGKGLVLLPINFSDIGSMTHANNITNIYNESGAFISVGKQTSVKTADGLFVTPTKIDDKTGVVTNLHMIKSLSGDIVLDDELDNLRKIDNSNFNITKQLSSANYHSTIGSSSNHIFYPDKEHHNFYWEAPSNISHLYLFDNRNANITIAQANGILDFSQLNSTLNDMPFIENNKGEIKINKNGLNVTLLPNYKDVTVTFDGEEYYKFHDGELERDYCSHSLKIDGRFSVNGTDLLNHHNCFTFDSDKVLFLKLNNDLLLLSDRGALSISDYYSSIHKNWDLSIELSNRIVEPEEFGERADGFSSFRYYQPDEQGLQIYHNQPINKNDIGLVDLKDKSILNFDMKVVNDNLLLSYKNNTLVEVENWNTYQPAREMMFAFNDTIVSNAKCIASTCNSKDLVVEFNKEKLVLSTEQLFDAVKQNNLSEVKNLLNIGVDINIRDRRGWAPLHYAASKGYLNVVKYLIEKGASLEAKANDGKTPLDIAIEQKHNNVVEYLEKVKEERGERKRRHHHGGHSRHHLSRKPLAIDSNNQPEIATSSGIRPSSWINDCISWVKSSVGRLLSSKSEGTASSVSQFDGQFTKQSISNSSFTGTTLPSDDTDKRQENGGFFRDNVDYVNANLKRMCERQAPVKFKPRGRNTILEMGDHYLSQVDFNGTITLFDLLIRRFTGQKYISTVDQSISSLKAQGYALNITKGFEKVVEQAGLKSDVSMHRLNIDYMGIQKEIVRKVIRGQFNEISGVLSSYLEKACPSREAGCPGKLSSKKFDKFMVEFNGGLNVVLNQSIQQILHNGDGRLEVDSAKQMNLEPQSYLSNASVHSYSEVSNCLSEIGVTKLGGNLNR
ncbi:tetratricopeptide repeat protein [Wolbachia endosymbiont (group A) of Rhorus exstirpatorius]|uniref:tetratricopeptide repeat protein n=1 Tax=Wolbachia endosymbiont (group A) of Rhorus exstirpatorius TaxID=3066213 RepID=UPI0033423699